MPGSAVMDPDNLVDDMVGVIDDLRGELHPEFGVRAYRVYSVLRTWTGATVGSGKKSDVTTEITPQPKILVWDGRKFVEPMPACGINEAGKIRVEEISLTYTFAELCGGDLAPNQQWMLKIGEAHGQGQPDTFWIHDKAPFADREKTLAWIAWLSKVEARP